MLLVLSSLSATVEGSDSWYKRANSFPWMSMGTVLANTSVASVDMVRKALITSIAESLCTMIIGLAYDFVSST